MGGKPRQNPRPAAQRNNLADALDRIADLEDEVADLDNQLEEARSDLADALKAPERHEIESDGIRLRLGNCELEVWRGNRLVGQIPTSPSDHAGPVGELVAAIVDLLR